MTKYYVFDFFFDCAILLIKHNESMTIFTYLCARKTGNFFSHWKILPNSARSAVCFKCMFYILKVCFYRSSPETKDLLKDCERASTCTQMNCLDAIDIFLMMGLFSRVFVKNGICRNYEAYTS